MVQYIDKDALIAYIKSCISDIKISQKAGFIKKRDANNRIIFFKSILSFLDTLEVKEVDLEEEICSFFSKNPIPYEHITDWPLLKNCAIYFFELGLKAQKGE